MTEGVRSGGHVYLIGVCGTGMAALAGLLKARGYRVTGADGGVYPPMSTFLEEQGIPVHDGYDSKHLDPEPDLVVIGNALSRGNPEVECVLDRGIRYASLPEALKAFFIRGKTSVVVTGTHGKTTVSSLIAWALEGTGKDPGFFIGGIPENFGQGFKAGKGPHFVVEGDEYDTAFFDKGPKFLHYLPEIVVLNGVEFDHADIYGNLEEIKVAFRRLINIIPRNGLLALCSDDDIAVELGRSAFCPVQSFGRRPGSDWTVNDLRFEMDRTTFTAVREGESFGAFSIPLRGNHNVRNALGAIAVCDHLGLKAAEIRDSLSEFKGIRRRLTVRGVVDDVTVFDDFAHHPTEVRETLHGLRLSFPDRRIWAVFEPRSATAIRSVLQEDYPPAFDPADRVTLAPVFRPEKAPDGEGIQVERLVSEIAQRGKQVEQAPSIDAIVAVIADHAQAGDLVVCMSNGGFGGIHKKLLNALKESRHASQT